MTASEERHSIELQLAAAVIECNYLRGQARVTYEAACRDVAALEQALVAFDERQLAKRLP